MMSLSIRRLTTAALCLAIGILLPQLVHAVPDAGSILLPMHLPVLLCGFLAGKYYGLACGALAPLLSSLLTSMPPLPILPGMMAELATYGLLTGVLFERVHTGSFVKDSYLALIPAMLAGRAVAGILNALVFRAGEYSLSIFLTASFVTSLPGILTQLVLIPMLLVALKKAGLVTRYA